ncbi:MAG: MATE family efflux transporter [Alphaproteobacteria bacterium]|nr:MATE family efflux transporter [Alphaproteobacteria bacterium]
MQTLQGQEEEAIGLRQVLRLAWPIMIARLSYTGMTFSDTLFVGQLGTTALAAVGIAGVASFAALAGGHGLIGSVRILASHRTGAGEHGGAARLAWQGLWMALALAPICALLTLGSLPLLSAIGASEEALPMADAYLRVRLFGAPLELASLAMCSWFQGRGDTRTPMIGTLLGNVLNVALDPLFIFGLGPLPGLGLAGAALATSLSSGVGLAFLIRRARPAMGAAEGPRVDELRALLRLGAPMGTQYSLDVMAFLVFVGVLARVGEAAVAGHVIALRIVSLSFLPGFALGEAAGVLVGQRLGAGRPDEARRAWKIAMALGVLIMASWAVVFLVTPEPMVAVFGPSAEVAGVASGLLAIAAAFQILDAIAMIGLHSLQGGGDTRFCMGLSLSAAWLVKIPVGILLALPLGMGAAGAWWALVGELSVLAIAALLRLRGDAWTRSVLAPSVAGAAAAAK